MSSLNFDILPVRSSQNKIDISSCPKLIDLSFSSEFKIVKGKFGQDKCNGNITCMSSNGIALLTTLMLYRLFPTISNLVVHYLLSFFSYAAIYIYRSVLLSE